MLNLEDKIWLTLKTCKFWNISAKNIGDYFKENYGILVNYDELLYNFDEFAKNKEYLWYKMDVSIDAVNCYYGYGRVEPWKTYSKDLMQDYYIKKHTEG